MEAASIEVQYLKMATYVAFVFIWCRFFKSTLKTRYEIRYTFDIVFFIIVELSNGIVIFCETNDILRLFSGVIPQLVYVCVVYKDTFTNKATAFITYLLILVVSDYMIWMLCTAVLRISHIALQENLVINFYIAIVYILLYYCIYKYAAKLIQSWKKSRATKKMKCFATFLGCQIITLWGYGWIYLFEAKLWIQVISVLSTLGVVLSGYSLLYAVQEIAKKAELSIKNEYMEQEQKMQMQHYNSLNEQYILIRKLRHDILNHIYTIQILYQNGEIEKANQYLDDLQEQFENLN